MSPFFQNCFNWVPIKQLCILIKSPAQNLHLYPEVLANGEMSKFHESNKWTHSLLFIFTVIYHWENRTCTSCQSGLVQDEFHFLIACDKFNEKRQRLYNDISILDAEFFKLTDPDKFKYMMLANSLSSARIARFTYEIYPSYRSRTLWISWGGTGGGAVGCLITVATAPIVFGMVLYYSFSPKLF
jgi:hypothetical protein